MHCHHCHKPLEAGFKFCPHCGSAANTKSHCPGCKCEVQIGWTENEVKNILYQLLLILRDLHGAKTSMRPIIHRDLRLSNVLLRDGQVHLIDFGLARFLDSELIINQDSVNQSYELLRKEISPQSDLFGAGVVAVDLFTNWVEDEALEEPWEQVLPLSQEFVSYLKRLLQKEHAFKSVEEALQTLSVLNKF